MVGMPRVLAILAVLAVAATRGQPAMASRLHSDVLRAMATR